MFLKIGIAIVCITLLPLSVDAAVFQNPLALKFVNEMLKGLVLSVIYVGTPALVVFIVWTGFLFASAQGSVERLNKAKKMAVQVTVGGTLLLSLWAIVELVGNTLAGFSALALLLVFAAFYFYLVSRG